MTTRITLFALFLLCCLGTLHAQTPLPKDAPVVVYLPKDPKPAAMYQQQQLGDFKIRDGFRISCGLEETLAEARERARKLGGNIVRVTKLKYPEVMSTCYRLEAIVYHTDSLPYFQQTAKAVNDSVERSLISDTASYALVYVYRNPNYVGSLIGYNLHADDSVVCRVHDNGKEVVKLYKTGKTVFWAKTEARDEETVDLQPGKVYFVSCSMKMGVAIGRPTFQFVPAVQGYREYMNVGKAE